MSRDIPVEMVGFPPDAAMNLASYVRARCAADGVAIDDEDIRLWSQLEAEDQIDRVDVFLASRGQWLGENDAD